MTICFIRYIEILILYIEIWIQKYDKKSNVRIYGANFIVILSYFVSFQFCVYWKDCNKS